MASNDFQRPKYYDHVIVDSDGKVVGRVRVKPSGVLWKAKSAQVWRGVDLDTFVKFMDKSGKDQKQ